MANPLFTDETLRFMFETWVRPDELLQWPVFGEHDREGFELHLQTVTRFARETLWPTFGELDREPPRFEGGRVFVHPRVHEVYPTMVELGAVAGERPFEVGGHQLPRAVATLASFPLMAANSSAVGFAYLTGGAAHLIESFGDEALRETFMRPMYEGQWTGTMALTEPQAGSALADLTTSARPLGEGRYAIRGSKIFISGGDQDFSENIVHLTLARVEGAPAGLRGVSLFAVPRLRPEGEKLVFNDVHTSQVIHKIGWKGLPSVALSYGEKDDCVGWLVGSEGRGLSYMFQMMNGARIFVGANGVATASAAYHESLAYARERRQGRPLGRREAGEGPVAIIEHPDVRRMLLRQKAIVEGGMALVLHAARLSDTAEHHADEKQRERAAGLLDLLTPVTKSFPAEWGFESNALAVQIHGGYGYTSEYPVEAYMREQKLNSIHEGTTGIQGLDLLGRKMVARGGADLRTLVEEMTGAASEARGHGLEEIAAALESARDQLVATSTALGARGMAGEVDAIGDTPQAIG